jgi:citrate lyase beta subunit
MTARSSSTRAPEPVLASAVAALARPIDGVVADVADEHGLRVEASRARALGFGAKACIHPRQLEIVAAAFRPDETEIAWARRIDAGYRLALAESRGAALVDGEMVDAPVAARARLILEEAGVGA